MKLFGCPPPSNLVKVMVWPWTFSWVQEPVARLGPWVSLGTFIGAGVWPLPKTSLWIAPPVLHLRQPYRWGGARLTWNLSVPPHWGQLP